MKIRRIEQSDYKYISTLYNKNNTDFLTFKAMTIDEVRKMDNDRYMYIVEVDNQLIGYCSLTQLIVKKEFVFGMVIDKKHRGKGYGKQLLKLIEDEAKRMGCETLKLKVNVKNIPAINLYIKSGFEEKYKLIIMEKKINN